MKLSPWAETGDTVHSAPMRRGMFHHPDVCWTVIRRRSVAVFLDALACYGRVVTTRGRCLHWANFFPSSEAYHMARYRLFRAGILAGRASGREGPHLELQREGPRDTIFRPQRLWNQRWSGFWHVIVYDIPEARKSYRDALRHILLRYNLGCLQKSVWISPRDLRPVYDDLVQAAGLSAVSYLLEARTVLGRSSQELVRAAWGFPALSRRQDRFIEEWSGSVSELRTRLTKARSIETVVRQELLDYRDAMALDPLLPRELIPPGYRGFQAFRTHSAFVTAVRQHLRTARWG